MAASSKCCRVLLARALLSRPACRPPAAAASRAFHVSLTGQRTGVQGTHDARDISNTDSVDCCIAYKFQPWLVLQRRTVKFLRATHAEGERQGNFSDIQIKISNFKKEDKGTTVLAGDVFDVPIRRDIAHRVVVWQLAKRRQGTHCTKTIREVSGTGRKPYKQKGTGQARHGTLRGPQFRHGATMHGPKPRDYSYNLPKKVRRLGLKIALSARVAEGKLLVMDDVTPASHKTKEMAVFLKGLEDCKRVLFVEGSDNVNTLLCRSTSNLYAADVLPAKGLNVYSILQHDTLVMSLDAVRHIEDRLHTPINR